MTYTATLVENKCYEIETEFNGEPVKFRVVVAQDESEIAELIEFRLNELANPLLTQEQMQTPDLASMIQEQQALITTLTERIAALEAK